MEPLITHRTATFPAIPDNEQAFERLLAETLGIPGLHIPRSVLRRFLSPAEHEGETACVIAHTGDKHKLVALGAARSYSLALDIGTTNLVGLLYDNIAQKDVLTRSIENPQIAFGSDILTRLHHAMAREREAVYLALTRGINALVALLCRDAGIECGHIHAIAAAGNTAMTHFFLGLDVSTIPVAPWAPAVRIPGFRPASGLGLDICPEAPVYAFPNAGSYVGGDITAGIVATGMHASDSVNILVDVGTNAEVVIGNRDWMIVGAGAAGPALEEGISGIGRRARTGIIYDVEIRGREVSCRTFDEGAPEGICGSGMISLVYELYRAGIIDQTGTFRDDRRIAGHDGERRFVLRCAGGEGLAITQTEVRNFLRSKAAMFTLLLTLTRSVGVPFREIGTVFVAGALGTGIDVTKAAGIGMVPAWPASRIKAAGNTSLAGCRMLLADASLAGLADGLVDRITYKPMHDDPEFMKEFRGAVFIPHTDPELLKAD